jgi:methionyl-tRNA formyltransferase
LSTSKETATKATRSVRYAFAGDRDIAVRVLRYLLARDDAPAALVLPPAQRASHARELSELCAQVPDILITDEKVSSPEVIERLGSLQLDLILSIHYPLILPAAVLTIPRLGAINLHPAFLPYNRGWHTPSWAILDDTPAGATLHFMSEELDAGDIIHQRRILVDPADTAHSLYQKMKQCELSVFEEAWPSISDGRITRFPQSGEGTTHHKADLFSPHVQRIDLHATTTAELLLRRLRGLTTNRLEEAAYIETSGKRFRVRVTITPEEIA